MEPYFELEVESDRYAIAAQVYWDILEPDVPRNSIWQPLHETMFSMSAYKYTFAYKTNPVVSQAKADLAIKQLVAKTQEFFYLDTVWFKKHRNYIKHYVLWCEENHDGDYYLSSSSIYDYLQYIIEEKQQQYPVLGADSMPEITVYNHVRIVIATLERIALWQGQQQFSSGLGQQDPFNVLIKQLDRATKDAKGVRAFDYAAESRP